VIINALTRSFSSHSLSLTRRIALSAGAIIASAAAAHAAASAAPIHLAAAMSHLALAKSAVATHFTTMFPAIGLAAALWATQHVRRRNARQFARNDY
jgi:hypothetical protein